ncbi:MAG: hypothetical protein K8R68_10500, partial [Bacteroidales bacterium]|nr:hypothetical protein [Bacteroidales bacterium]
SAFTYNSTGSTTTAPVYVSTDGGNNWSHNNIVPSGNGMTGDISLAFGSSSGILYAGILRGGLDFLRCMMLRTTTPTANTTMTILEDRDSEEVDQPFVNAITADDASSIPRDRVFSGDNLYGSRISAGGNGRTAEVMFTNDGEADPFLGFTNQIIETRTTHEQDMPAIRTAIHNSGVVYAIYYSWQSGGSSLYTCDVVVVRDDNFATGTTPFSNLTDATDANIGQRVVTEVLVPAFNSSAYLGNNRLVASNLAIAVDPDNSANVFIGWCDRVGTTDYTLHFRRSTDSGQTWGSSDLLTITNATNPGIAITNNGYVGLIYQQLTGSGSTATWETHFQRAWVNGTSFTDDILSKFLDSDLAASTIRPELGDYLDMVAVGNSFYGVFPASNSPDDANFPLSVTYLRNADFTTKQLRNVTNTANVNVSVDPFFFRISPQLFNLCERFPALCDWEYFDKFRFRIPPYPIIPEFWPCLQCPPFEIPLDDIYKYFWDAEHQTILNNPYFHLFIDGYDPKDFNIVITTKDGDLIKQHLNKTEKGFAISFHPSKNYFNTKDGIQGLKLTAMPNNSRAAKKGAEFSYRLETSDYQFEKFMKMRK